MSDFLLSLASDRDLCKSDRFSFCCKCVYERVNEGEFPMAEILSTSNTGSMPRDSKAQASWHPSCQEASTHSSGWNETSLCCNVSG